MGFVKRKDGVHEMNDLIEKVRGIYEQFDASHDFQHIERVYHNALAILHTEPEADAEVVKWRCFYMM